MVGSSVYTKWAYRVIKKYLETGNKLEFGGNIPPELLVSAGCFVTLHGPTGELRGCIGTILPTKNSLMEEIRENAIASSVRDTRFSPLKIEELEELEISVDVLGEPEETTIEQLDPESYGVIVESGWKRGVLLPHLEGVDTVKDQLKIVLWKARIRADEDYKIYRFLSTRYY